MRLPILTFISVLGGVGVGSAATTPGDQVLIMALAGALIGTSGAWEMLDL